MKNNFWIILILFNVITLSIHYIKHKTHTKHGEKSDNIVSFIGIIILFNIFKLIKNHFESKYMVISSLFISVEWIALWLYAICQKRNSGTLLFDLGIYTKHIESKIIWLSSFIVISIYFFLCFKVKEDSYTTRINIEILAIFSLLWSYLIYSVMLLLSKIELRRKGIFYNSQFINWEDIDSYYWESSKANTLTLRLPAIFHEKFKLIHIDITENDRNAVGRILRKKLPNKQIVDQQ